MAVFKFFVLFFVMVTVAGLSREERDTVRILNGEPVLLQYPDNDNSTIPSSACDTTDSTVLFFSLLSAVLAYIFV